MIVDQKSLASLLGVTPATLITWQNRGLIPAGEKRSRQRWYPLREVLEAVEQNKIDVYPPHPLDTVLEILQ